MRRLVLALTAAATLASPMLAAGDAAAQGNGHRADKWERKAEKHARKEHRKQMRRWDRARDNGYYYNSRWYYGPPPQAYYDRPGFEPGYRAWSRGVYLPQTYRSYVVYDYGRYSLRPPPRGQQWVNVNNDYLLIAAATGLILDVINR